MTEGSAAGYVRVSQVGGRAGDSFLSPDLQRDRIEAWAAYRGMTVTRWYIDLDVSGREGVRRPEFERLMADASTGAFEAVAVYRLTRFARSVSDAARRYRELRALGIRLVSVTEDFDTGTASGGLVQNMLFALAEFESARIGEEWRAVHASRRRRGIAHVARPIIGYRIEGAELAGIDPAEAPAVRLAYTLRAQGMGLLSICRRLDEAGYLPKSGRPGWSKNSVRKILQSPLYAGLVRHGDELIAGRHEPIVTRELWDTVQARWRRTAEHARGRHLLAGILYCGSCGGRMRHEPGGARLYRCGTYSRGGDRCPRPVAIRAEAAERHVEAAALARLDPARMPNRGRRSATDRQATWREKAAALHARADELTAALDRLAEQRYVKGTLEAGEHERQTLRLLAERDTALREADELAALANTVRPIPRDVLAAWPTLPDDARRAVLSAMIHRVDVAPAARQGGPPGRGVDVSRLAITWAG